MASHDVGHGRLCRIEKGEDGLYTVHYEEEGGKAGSCRAGVVMFGTGRHPNTRDIGLEACPVALPYKGDLFSDKYRHPPHPVCLSKLACMPCMLRALHERVCDCTHSALPGGPELCLMHSL